MCPTVKYEAGFVTVKVSVEEINTGNMEFHNSTVGKTYYSNTLKSNIEEL